MKRRSFLTLAVSVLISSTVFSSLALAGPAGRSKTLLDTQHAEQSLPSRHLTSSTTANATDTASSKCTGTPGNTTIDVGQANGTVAISSSPGVIYFGDHQFDGYSDNDPTCASEDPTGTVDFVNNETTPDVTLWLPPTSVVTFTSPLAASTEIRGVTYTFSSSDFSTILSGGSSTIVVSDGVSITGAAGNSGINIGGMLFGQGFSTFEGNGSSTGVSLSGESDFNVLSTAGDAEFGSLNLIDVTGTITGTSAMQVLLPNATSCQVTVAHSSVTVTINSTPISFESFGTYAAQATAVTSFSTDGSVAVNLVGNGPPSSLALTGPGPGTIDYSSSSSGSAELFSGSSTTTTTFSGMGHVASSWLATVPVTTVPPPPPLSPPIVVATPSAPALIVATVPTNSIDKVTVTWNAPEDGGSPITSYTVTPFDETTGVQGTPFEVEGSATSATVTGLQAGDVYTFTVRATNAVGTSGASGTSNTVVPVIATTQSETTGSSNSPTGTASASVSSSSPNSISVVVHASGRGSVTLGIYRGDPLSQADTKSIANSGNVVSSYLDIAIAPTSHFSSLKFTVCKIAAGQQLMWWDPTQGKLLRVTKQSAISGANLCINVEITGATNPNLSDLFGTVFAVVTPQSYAAATSPGSYWVLSFNGQVKSYGKAKAYGSVAWRQAGLLEPFVAISPSMDAKGYLIVSRNGTVLSFGDAKSYGSVSNLQLRNSSQIQIIAITRTVDGKGYWLTASDGNVFAFGDAKFYGSAAKALSSQHNVVITGAARTHDGKGYWLVSNNGEVFAFGDAGHYGSATNATAISGMASASTRKGYWLVSALGAVYPFGNVRNYGSLANKKLPAAIIGITPTADGKGYYLINAAGSVTPFGDAQVKAPKPTRVVTAAAITTP